MLLELPYDSNVVEEEPTESKRSFAGALGNFRGLGIGRAAHRRFRLTLTEQ